MEEKDDIKLDIHPILEMLEDSFLFFIISQNIMAMPLFQKIIVNNHGGKMGEVTTSVKANGFNSLKFEAGYVFNRFNKKVNLEEKNGQIECNIKELLIQQGRLISIALFNILESSCYNTEIRQEKMFNFIRHLRNGAAHGNRFSFKDIEIKRLKKQKIYWRGKIIDHTLQGKQVFGEFIHISDLCILMNDISKKLYKIDKNNKKIEASIEASMENFKF